MDLARLRVLLRPLIGSLKDHGTHDKLPSLCAQLGMPIPGPGPSKRDRLFASFDGVSDARLAVVAQEFLQRLPPAADARNEIQEVLWADRPGPPVPKKYRRDLARAIAIEELFGDSNAFDALIVSLFVIGPRSIWPGERSLREQINRHVYDNRGDWTSEVLFDHLGAYECSDRRFCLFLEGLATGEVHPEEPKLRQFVGAANEQLRACRVEVRESGEQGGYPVFRVVSLTMGPSGRPKNLIFASPVKPDLRFLDAVSNDIEVVSNADHVLVYDRHIGPDGLRWSDLQEWWAERENLSTEAAKPLLYNRLLNSLPQTSPPQRRLFTAFFKTFGSAVPRLPVLLPEVWLHWDPKSVAERGAEALSRFRMDFLLLLPNGGRVVVEVDGKQHYADADGRASPTRYGEMLAADRDLRLSGYEVYRFGGSELDESARASRLVADFFTRLFKRHGVAVE